MKDEMALPFFETTKYTKRVQRLKGSRVEGTRMVVCKQMTVSSAEHAVIERETPVRDFQPPLAAEPLNGQPLNPKGAYAGDLGITTASSDLSDNAWLEPAHPRTDIRYRRRPSVSPCQSVWDGGFSVGRLRVRQRHSSFQFRAEARNLTKPGFCAILYSYYCILRGTNI